MKEEVEGEEDEAPASGVVEGDTDSPSCPDEEAPIAFSRKARGGQRTTT